MMRHIIHGIEDKLGSPMPEVNDEKHVIDLCKIG
ncbi:hypothetical protein F442_15828 [Phytophthora nicotianae P10297]|uniref:Uncharacterized protein n=1 Tax=Phytophthora nicotianae P10297 TaxID=1317064 RepID=W2YNC4_PHYNI|nr:hypothetical protein F442_15828 [Phytophthora nicotianae P10297]